MNSKMKSSPSPAKGLGRGLASLITSSENAPLLAPQDHSEVPTIGGEKVKYIPLKKIIPNRFQPRSKWDPEKLRELAESIKSSGLLQPLLVRKVDGAVDEQYELIAGERRLNALKLAGLEEAPALVRAVDDQTSLEMAIIENIQREELNPIDEAIAFRRLIQEFQYRQEDLSQKVGRDRSTVTNSLRLLNLSPEIQRDLAEGKITAGHGRALLSLEQERDRISLEQLIIRKGLSVRETERLVREARERKASKKGNAAHNAQIRFLEEALMALLGTKVIIKHRGKKGRIEIEYYSLEDLDRLVKFLQEKKGGKI